MSNIRMHLLHVRQSEKGMVAIMTTMVLMIVISLIVLGFAQISRRNQRESLDRQLSAQAFYAAESGVNDAREIIKAAAAAGQEIRDKTQCTGSGAAGFYSGLQPVIDSGKNVRYTCLLVDPAPTALRYPLGNTSKVIPIISDDGSSVSTIRLEWKSEVAGSPLIGCPTTTTAQFRQPANWTCGYGVLRFDLVPTGGSSLTPESLRNSTMSSFILPSASAGDNSVSYKPNATNNTNSKLVRCTDTSCVLEINVASLGQNTFHMRISSIYREVKLQLTASGAAGNSLEIRGAQVVIDSTGKAQDVLRRIQVNVPYAGTSENQLSDYAIESRESVCKRYAVMNGYIANQADESSTNRMCRPFTSP